MASLGDIHNSPHYDTSYQHHHGYNERNLQAKARVWNEVYQFHVPSAQRIRQRFLTKPGRDEQGRTLSRNAEVAEVIQARTALLGTTFDLSTANSLRVEKRHGESGRLGESQWPIPLRAQSAFAKTRFGSTNGTSISDTPEMEQWSQSTVPADRTSSLRMQGAGSALRHPSAKVQTQSSQPWNSRQSAWETEYSSGFSDVKTHNLRQTNRPDFLSRSLLAFEDPVNNPTDSHVHRVPRPLSPTQPLIERQSNERISQPGLVSMQRPLHRKTYEDLQEHPAAVRPEPYNFDLNYHIERMRPGPLFKDRTASGERISQVRTARPQSLQQLAESSWQQSQSIHPSRSFSATAR